MDIYWIQGHEQKGPLPEVEVISMLEAGLIPEDARAWHAGCPEWVCIRDLPALKGAGAVSRGEGERRNREEEETGKRRGRAAAGARRGCGSPAGRRGDGLGGGSAAGGSVCVRPFSRQNGGYHDAHDAVFVRAQSFPAWLPIPVSFLVPMKLCFTSASRWFSLKTALSWYIGNNPGKSHAGRFRQGLPGKAPFFPHGIPALPVRHGAWPGRFAPSLMLLALFFFSWWWVRRFGFTPWDRKLGTTRMC